MGIVVVMAAMAVTAHAWRKSRSFPHWAALCCVIALVGWLCLILAPGNYKRLMHEAFAAYRASTPIQRIEAYILFWLAAQVKFLPLTGIIMAGALASLRSKLWREKNFITAIAIVGMAQLTLGAFLFSVLPSDRALTATAILLCASAAFFLTAPALPHLLRYAMTGITIICCAVSLEGNLSLFRANDAITAERLHLLSQSDDPVIPSYRAHNKYFFIGGDIADLDTDWTRAAAYYGVKSIRIHD